MLLGVSGGFGGMTRRSGPRRIKGVFRDVSGYLKKVSWDLGAFRT